MADIDKIDTDFLEESLARTFTSLKPGDEWHRYDPEWDLSDLSTERAEVKWLSKHMTPLEDGTIAYAWVVDWRDKTAKYPALRVRPEVLDG